MKKYPKIVLRKDDSPIDGHLSPLRPVRRTRFGRAMASPFGVVIALLLAIGAVLAIPVCIVAILVALQRPGNDEVRAPYATELKHALFGDDYVLSFACPSEAGVYRTRISATGYGDAHRVAGVRWPMCKILAVKPVGEDRWGAEPYEIELECPANWERKTVRLSAMSLDEAVKRGAPHRAECEVRTAWRDCSGGRRERWFCTNESKQFKPQRLP